MKYTVRPAGIVTYQNTFLTETSISNFSNGHFRNNLFLGPDDNRPSLNGTTFTNYSTMDYDGYRKKKSSQPGYRWRYPTNDSLNNAEEKALPVFEFKTLNEFSKKTGYETHGVELDYDIFENVPMPDPKRKGHVYPSKGYDFRLKPSSKAIDAGCVLPNINDQFTGKAPDLGALERDLPAPHYGPRK